ncbi:MAG: hypothetical protein MJA83_11025 [Gammaproteobacteria bacterium]|nr:hypothetical protein [Gammaproteobacteria bacterium]
MKNFHLLVACSLLALCWSVSSPVFSYEPLTVRELVEYCEAYKNSPAKGKGRHCAVYIKGFLDGAVITDERVTYNVADEYEKDESLTERAVRTRLGNRIKQYGGSFYAEFCVGQPVPIAAVVKNVIDDLDARRSVEGRAREAVYASLRKHYPCT